MQGNKPFDAASSNIIPFPGNDTRVKDSATQDADDAAAALTTALLTLARALASQQLAIRAWRRNIGGLADAIGTLSHDIQLLDVQLRAVSIGKAEAATGVPESKDPD